MKKSCFVEEGFAVYEQQHAINNQFSEVRYFVDQNKFDEMQRFEMQPGDLIMSCSGTMGKVAVVPPGIKRGIINQALLKLSVNGALDVEFLRRWMESPHFQIQLEKSTKGVAIKNVASVKVLKEIEIVHPSLQEQKRIVATLDDVFERIDTAIANTEKNLANARELFESYLNNVFTQKGEGWEEKALSYFSYSVSTGPFGSMLHKSDYKSTGVPLVNPINIIDGAIVPDSKKLIDEATRSRLESYVLKKGDLVLARRGEIGRCAVVAEDQDGWVCGTGCFFVQLDKGTNPEFMALLFQSNCYREKLESVATGATMKNLSNRAVKDFIVSVPPRDEQDEIISILSSHKVTCGKLETIYQQKLDALIGLKQSVLQKAFAGEL